MPGASKGLIRPYSATLVEFNRGVDALWLISALWLACWLLDLSWGREDTLATVVALIAFTLAANHLQLYRSWRVAPLRDELVSMWLCWSLAMVAVAFASYAAHPVFSIQRPTFLLWFCLGLMILTATRSTIRLTLREARRRGRNFRRAAIIGATDVGRRADHNIRHTTWMGLRSIGFFDDRCPKNGRKPPDGIEIQGSVADLERLATAGEVDIVYVALPMRAELRIKSIIERFSDTTVSVHYVPDFSDFDLLSARWDVLGNIPIVSIVNTPIQGVNAALKRATDLIVSLIALALLGLPMLGIGVAIKLTSPGPVIFRQRRYGLDGKEFEMWKFRTMTVCEDGSAFVQAVRGDSRVTRIGAFLRRTSLDELPQFVNVLQGRMSVVGPRPHPVALNEQHRRMIGRYMLRHKVRPGITGWAQVSGFRGETDTPEKMQQRIAYDLEYIDRWSLWLDMRIIAMTLQKGFVNANAY